ncbi:MAG: hypothetical protein ACLU8W_11465 [Clostridia bacterium]
MKQRELLSSKRVSTELAVTGFLSSRREDPLCGGQGGFPLAISFVDFFFAKEIDTRLKIDQRALFPNLPLQLFQIRQPDS